MYVNDLDAAIADLAVCGVTGVRLRFGRVSGLQLTLVADVLVMAADDQTLEAFRTTDLTVVVDDLGEALTAVGAGGAAMVREPADQATGRNCTMTMPAGPTVECIEWNRTTRPIVGV